jgi:hypothetical protein
MRSGLHLRSADRERFRQQRIGQKPNKFEPKSTHLITSLADGIDHSYNIELVDRCRRTTSAHTMYWQEGVRDNGALDSGGDRHDGGNNTARSRFNMVDFLGKMPEAARKSSSGREEE